MILWLDFKIFGSGCGLGAPFWSQPFYWLVDANTEKGTFYTWSGWFGSQLMSFQWRHPLPQEERVLAGKRFRPFMSNRRLGRVEVKWKCDELKTSEQIIAFENTLTHKGTYYR